MWQAAAPVLAVIKVLCGGNIVIKRFKRYDLPVLALPVKNTLFPALMAFITVICSGIRFIWKELKELRRLLTGPLCSSSPQFESLSLPVVLNSFGVTPFLSCRRRSFLAAHCEILICRRAYVFKRPRFITEKPSSVTCNSILFTLSKFQWQTF